MIREQEPPHTPELSIVSPVFQSAECVPLLVERIITIMSIEKIDFETILVDDGSTDGSWEQIGKV